MSTPSNEPHALRAGDTWQWRRDDLATDYPAGTWTLTYRFRHPSAAGFEVIASADGTAHAVTVTAATTAGYTAGTYAWQAQVSTGAGEKHTVDEGTLTVAPSFFAGAASATYDGRTTARKILEAIELLLTGFTDVQEYSVGDVSIKKMTRVELLKARSLLQAEVRAEEIAERLRNGERVPNKLRVRF